ncbi:MAG: hypothetical protein RBR15_09985 [Sphaerochaeta sp.]|nr:hypothetical protein [Sphaerochaeta sp.]
MKLSEASERAMTYPKGQEEWSCGFSYTPVFGLGYEEGIHRRDPSSILEVDGVYYVWYTKSSGPMFGQTVRDPYAKKYPWDYANIFYATSLDGVAWEERGCAIPHGGKGDYDERTVCTPDVMEHEGKYYLVYQTLPQGTKYDGSEEHVAMAIASDPNGPWEKLEANILDPMDQGEWFGQHDNYNDGFYTGRCHDPMLFAYNEKFYLYYKCCSTGEAEKYAEVDTRWGVSIADCITGPYHASEYNPVTNSGHETLLWPYQGGIAALLNRDGPEKDTIQYAKDGINFSLMAKVQDTPQAGGAFRSKNPDLCPLEGIRWGLCHVDERGGVWNHIVRFDVDTRHPYCRPMKYPKSNCDYLHN